MKLLFWLLDINHKDRDGVFELQLWGITHTGERELVVDRSFKAYFYAMLHGAADPQKAAQEILTSHTDIVTATEVVPRKFFGRPVSTVKVTVKDPPAASKLAKLIRKQDGVNDCLEDDIRPSIRYLIDNGIAPCSWNTVEAKEEDNADDVRVDKVYVAESPPKPADGDVAPPLRVLAFHLMGYSHEGTPQPEKNPIMAVSTVASSGEEKQFTLGEDKNDKALLEAFISYLKQYDPDIIANYGANTSDWAYLKKRCHIHKLKLDFDRASSEPHTSVYGHVSTTGIANVDLADFADLFPEVKVKTLPNLAADLGVAAKDPPVEDVMFADWWDTPKKRTALLGFGVDSARETLAVAGLLMDLAMQLSVLTGLPLDHVMAAAFGFRVDWYLIGRAQKIGELIPRRLEQIYQSYTGGLVLTPTSGLHDDIAVLDFKSMYPNIMITYNLSPDTYVQPGSPEPESGVYVAPEVGHRFRKAPPGFYKEALSYLIEVRGEVRRQMKQLKPDSVEFRVLDARQKAVKILTNAAYGYAGWVGARWYMKPVAEAASAWGRHIILTAAQMSKEAGVEVIYGDTDSLFIKYDADKAQQLKEKIHAELKLDVEVGAVYKRIFFTEAKKRYAGLQVDGSLDFVGLEVIRGDWAEVAKQVQEHVLEIILREQSPQKAIEYVHKTVSNLRHRKIPLQDLIIWKTLTKPPKQYAIKAPHVAAAKQLIERGWRLEAGDKVGYVVLSGKGRLYSRVKPYIFANLAEVDVDYYVTNQVLPVASRILEFFNVSEKELQRKTTKEEENRSLTDYF